MRHLPRALNRSLLFLLGLLGIAAGLGMLLVNYKESARQQFAAVTKQIEAGYNDLYDRSLVAIPGLPIQNYSWLSIAWVAIIVILVLFLLAWCFAQGGGRVRELNLFGKHADTEDDHGEIVARLNFVDDLVQDALLDDQWIADVKTTAWSVKKQPGLSISVVAYKGADLKHLKEMIDQAIARVDSVLGNTVPVAVHLTTNWRSTFQSADRVDS